MRTSAYLGKVAEKYTLLQTKQKSHNGDRGVTEDTHSSNAVLSDMAATSHMCLLSSWNAEFEMRCALVVKYIATLKDEA